MSVGRNGIMRSKFDCFTIEIRLKNIIGTSLGILDKASNEQPEKGYTDAAINNVTDENLGLSTKIILGDLIGAGTGSFNVISDYQKMMDAMNDQFQEIEPNY